ncbi:anti-sigma F factor [Zongyangia hominis]|uniref:Anti-sigma F factor n=1 Tax=Zongyangia hominis TaxID=2763677 RepID=A0A926IBE8_9FIRM|nr:anti-sigma F factor [Zongyangia hominis]MBC8570213.1 anti-sigma F factor [Zongyangia hominis]
MNIINEMRLKIPSKSVNEGFARSAVASFAAQLDPTVAEIADIKTAVSEAVTNCIVHAYAGEIGMITLEARILEGGVFMVKIRDRGCGIADVKQAMEPLFTTAQGDERAGLGFSVMESFMDKVTVRSTLGKGTIVTLTKKIEQRAR